MTPHRSDDHYEAAMERAYEGAPQASYVDRPRVAQTLTLRELLDFELETQDLTRSQKFNRIGRMRMSAVRYYQLLNNALDNPEALAAEPELIYRLRTQRATRLAERASRTFRKR